MESLALNRESKSGNRVQLRPGEGKPAMSEKSGQIHVGIDTGGTFTDVVATGGERLIHFKVPSDPSDPAGPVLEGMKRVADAVGQGIVVHGSTIATNAVLERKGARVALVTTSGFEDVLTIGRQTRPQLYNLLNPQPRPIVPPAMCIGVSERISADGKVLHHPNPGELGELVARLRQTGLDAVAVCFLHSYANPRNERAIGSALRAAGFDVTCSSDILPEFREYERFCVAAVNAFLRPVLRRYYRRLEDEMPARGLRIMQSSGGYFSSAAARELPVHTLLSGPAGGVVGARAIAKAAGFENIITLDMGGTSADVSIIRGKVPLTTETTIDGIPIRLPMIDLVTVGAGGGSIAWFDEGGALRVGPRSAGAQPGPVCYGLGEDLTVTDAHVLLGNIPADLPLGGVLKIHEQRTVERFSERAAAAGMDPAELAEGIIRVADATMERALRVVSVERGRDPRDFALFAFGGAGGLHACRLAATLRIGTVIIPDRAGIISALGMLLADAVRSYSRTVFLRGEGIDPAMLEAEFNSLVKDARVDLGREGFAEERIVLHKSLAMRYVGQSYELDVPFTAQPPAVDFHAAHEQRYGYCDTARPVEVVNIVLRAVGATDKPAIPSYEEGEGEGERKAAGLETQITIGGKSMSARLFNRPALAVGAIFDGPAVVTDLDATALVPPGWGARVDRWRNMILRRGAAE